jgi:hypothetical protein
MKNGILEGDGTWPWLQATIDGDDIVVRGIIASNFDDSSTASGIPANIPNFLGCAVPMNIPDSATAGSPIPRMPIASRQIFVRAFCNATNKQVMCRLIVDGPNKMLMRGLDLTPAAFVALGFDPAAGLIHGVDYRILGGAEFVDQAD